MVLEITGGIDYFLCATCHAKFLCELSNSIHSTVLRGGHYLPHFAGEQTAAERSEITWPESHSWLVAHLPFEPKLGQTAKSPFLTIICYFAKLSLTIYGGAWVEGKYVPILKQRAWRRKPPTWRSFGEAKEILTASHRLFTSSLSSSAKVKVQGGVSRILQSPQKSLKSSADKHCTGLSFLSSPLPKTSQSLHSIFCNTSITKTTCPLNEA